MRKMVISWRAIGLAVIVLSVCFVLGVRANSAEAREAAAKQTALQYALTQLEQQQLALRGAIANVGSDSYIEATARAQLDYMKPGELRFEIVNSELLVNYRPEESQILAEELARSDW